MLKKTIKIKKYTVDVTIKKVLIKHGKSDIRAFAKIVNGKNKKIVVMEKRIKWKKKN